MRGDVAGPPVLAHSAYSLIAKGSMLVARGVALILISRRLGGEHFGIYALLLATYSLCSSVGAFGIEQTSLYLAGRRQKRLPVLVGNSLLLAVTCGLITAVLCFAAVLLLRQRFFTGATWEVAAVTALGLPIGIAHNALVGLVVGLGRFRYYGIAEVCKWAGYLTLVGVFYVQNRLDVLTALGSFFLVLLGAGFVHLMVFVFRWHVRPTIRLRLLRRMLRLGQRMLLVQVTSVLALRLDVYAVRYFGTIGLVGTYALASQLGEILMYVARSFAVVVFSGAARGSRPAALRLRLLGGGLVLTAVGLALGILLLHENVIVALFGETSRGSVPALLLRMPGVLAAAIALLFAGEMLGRARPDLVIRGNGLAVVSLAMLVGTLCRWDTVLGAAGAFTFASLVQVFWMARVRRAMRVGQGGQDWRGSEHLPVPVQRPGGEGALHILYIHQYFCTREGRSGTRSYEFSKYLAERGHRVTMITSTSALSDVRPEAGRAVSRFHVDGIDVVAVRVPYAQAMGWGRRVWSFLRFMWLSTWLACRERRHDVIVATSTPLTVGVPGLVASRWRRTPLVFEVRDLWPEAPIQLGVIRNRAAIALLRWFERLVYVRSARIVALSPGMRDGIVATGVAPNRVDMIPNCSDLDLFHPGRVNKAALASQGLENAFVVTHAGSLGLANGLDVVLDAAAAVQQRGWDDVRIVLLGEGAAAATLRADAGRRGLRNIVFLGGVPRQEVGRILEASDVCLVVFRDVPVLGTNSPNKLFDALAAGRPVIVNTAGWMRDLVQQHGIGLVARAGSGSALAEQIGVLRADASLRVAMGERARRLAESEFERRMLAARFETSLVRAAGKWSAPQSKPSLGHSLPSTDRERILVE